MKMFLPWAQKAINPAMLVLARQSRGMLRRDLAKATEMAHSQIRSLERGESKPTGYELAELSKALHYPHTFFFHKGEVERGRIFISVNKE